MGIRIEFSDDATKECLCAAGLANYEQFMDPHCGRQVWRTGTTLTRKLSIPTPTRSLECYLKIYHYAGDRWRHRFRKDKAALEARNYRLLRGLCRVPVPDVLAHGVRRRGTRLIDAFILTRAIENAVPLDQFADSIISKSGGPSTGSYGADPIGVELFEQSVDLVRRMHEAGFYHIDLQWRNILVQQPPGRLLPKLYIIDSPRGGRRWWGAGRAYGRLRDLSSLAKDAADRLTRAEQVRWLCYYFGVERLDIGHREIVYAIQRDRQCKDRSPEESSSPS